MTIKAVILAGGVGTRLWPLSRQHKPKQLQSLVTEKTLLQETIDRINFLDPQDIFISTNQEYVDEIRSQAPQIPERNIIVEPACRDTAPCIGFAATYIAKQSSPEEVMAVVYADHLVQNPKIFMEKLLAAEKLSQEQNTLNIIEVQAKFPNVNLGYVKIGEKLEEIDGHPIHEFKEFKEKPNLHQAQDFLTEGNYLWNTGFYVWKIDRILEEYKKNAPQIYEKLMTMQTAINTPEEKQVIEEHYSQCEKISIDYAIMEKLNPADVRIIPADIQWSDIGTWSALHEELAAHPSHNITKGEHIGLETTGSLIYATSGKPIATIGLHDMVVVETQDAILICPKNRSQDVKKLVEKLKKEKPELL